MKRGIKPNQSRIFKVKVLKERKIKAIKIDVENKIVSEIKIENNINALRAEADFFNYKEVEIIEEKDDRIFVSNDTQDNDFKKRKRFTIKNIEDHFFGDGIIVKIPKSGDLERLQSTKVTVDIIREMVFFK